MLAIMVQEGLMETMVTMGIMLKGETLIPLHRITLGQLVE
jgi:hypothetical protein